jgi:membrane associated rhomboid family serine protease
MYQISTPRLPPCVKGLIIANVAVFILQLFPVGDIGKVVTNIGAMKPVLAFKYLQLWRLVTYMFLHSPDMLFHILFNMLSLWWFGVELEDIWGKVKFLIFYFVCGIGSGLFTVFYLFMNQPNVIVIGASGAVLGLLTAYAIYYPQRQVLFFGLFPMKMRTLVIGYAAISIFFSISGGGGNVSHIVHLGGIVVAYVYLKVAPVVSMEWNKRLYFWRSKRQIDKMTKR